MRRAASNGHEQAPNAGSLETEEQPQAFHSLQGTDTDVAWIMPWIILEGNLGRMQVSTCKSA